MGDDTLSRNKIRAAVADCMRCMLSAPRMRYEHRTRLVIPYSMRLYIHIAAYITAALVRQTKRDLPRRIKGKASPNTCHNFRPLPAP